jgi:hypothetical protein
MGGSPGLRVSTGDDLIEAAKTISTAPIKKRWANFVLAHKAFSAAEKDVLAATKSLHDAEHVMAEADADQDHAVEVLASALVASGLPRANPFKPLGFASPSAIEKLPTSDETKEVHRLARAVRARKGVSKDALTAAKDLDSKATLVEKATAALPALEKTEKAAFARRTALGRPWATAFAKLKRAAETADDDAPGLFAALFEVEATPPTDAQVDAKAQKAADKAAKAAAKAAKKAADKAAKAAAKAAKAAAKKTKKKKPGTGTGAGTGTGTGTNAAAT